MATIPARSGAARRSTAAGWGDKERSALLLSSIATIARVVNADGDFGSLLNHICYAVCKHTAWSIAAVVRVDSRARRSFLMARFDPYSSEPPQTSWAVDTSPMAVVMRTRRPLILRNIDRNDTYAVYRDDAIARSYKTLVLLPLVIGDIPDLDLILSVKSRDDVPVDDIEIAFLEGVAHLAAIAIGKTHRLENERQRAEMMNRLLAAHRQLMDTALSATRLQDMIATSELMLPFPIAVVDLTRNRSVAGGSPDQRVPANAWRGYVEAQHDMLVQRLLAHRGLGEIGIELPISVGEMEETRRVPCEALDVEGERIGFILYFPQDSGIDDLTRLLMLEVNFAVGVHMMRSHIRLKAETKSTCAFITQLMRGSWHNRDDLHDQANQLRFDLRKPSYLMTVTPERQNTALGLDCISAIADTFRQLGQSALVAEVDGSIVALCRAADTSDDRMAEVTRRIVTRFRTFGEPIVTLSRQCAEPVDFRDAARASERVIRLARAFRRTGLLAEADFGYHAIMLSSIDRQAVTAFVAERLGAIEAYDRQHDGNLLETLAAFLAQGCRYQACADALKIHVTTLRYRLERIARLFEIDWEDPETRFGIELALRFRSYIAPG